VYASIDWGAGISGVLPWPSPIFSEKRDPPDLLGHETTRWEARFAELLWIVAGQTGWKFHHELETLDWRINDLHPIDAARNMQFA
jgi:hypothetical protein